MKLSFEYGAGLMAAELPDNTDVFIPGETVADPPCIPEDQLVEKTLESIRNPMGTEPLSKLAHKGSKVTIIFPDRVKGGEQPTSHSKISIKLILKELYGAGVEKKDILLICSNGLHRKNTETEIHNILGDELFYEFWHTHQIINHDKMCIRDRCSRAYRLRKDHIFKLPYQDSYAQRGRSVYRRSPCGPAQT